MCTAARRLGGVLTAVILLGGTATPAVAQAQGPEAKIQRAMEAAPPAISQDAAVIDVDGTVLREGSNGWTCIVEVAPGYGFPMCNDDVWMDLRAAILSQSEFDTDRIGISYMLAGDAHVNNADPYDTEPDEGETWVKEGPHLMIAVPDPAMLEGVPTDPRSEEPYVMWGDTPYAHIMVPVAPRPDM